VCYPLRYQFAYNDRLGIRLPVLYHQWEEYSPEERADILLEWEEIRAKIPDRIIQLETVINQKQNQLSEEENFVRSCELNSEIHELASVINDLNIWFRVQQDYETKNHQ
jgi:acyl-CoA reductase-like NAD-dependent aldehyde dehydrogenase